jgi:cell wall-associated NlpC family hydrolase
VSVADDLQEREHLAGNADDSGNPGDQHYKKSVNNGQHDEIPDYDRSADGVDDHEKEFDESAETKNKEPKTTNYNSDDYVSDTDFVKEKEENPESSESLYNGLPEGKISIKGTGGKGKKLLPIGGIVGLILFAVVGVSAGTDALAASLLINIKEIFHSDRADASRTNRLNSRAFFANKFNNKDGCTKKTAICDKMSSIGQAELKAYEDQKFKFKGTVIDANGKRVGDYDGDSSKLDPDGRVQISEAKYPDGTTAKNGKEFYAKADSDPNALRLTERASPSKSKFYLNKFFDSVLGKFGFKKGTSPFPAPDENKKDPNNQADGENNQDKTFNEEADAVHNDPNGGTSDGLKTKSDTVLKDVNVDEEVGKEKSNTKGGAAGAFMRGICSIYKLGNLTEVAVKAYHMKQLIRFGLLFFQAADEIKDGHGDGNRVSYLANLVTWYDNQKTVTQDTDYGDGNVIKAGSKNPKYNLSGTDAEGYQIAATGSTEALKAFSQRFILGGGIGKKVSGFTGVFENAANTIPSGTVAGDNGKEKMKNLCRLMNSPSVAILGSCATLVTLGTAVAPETVGISEGIALAGCACTVYTATPLKDAVNKLPEILRVLVPVLGQCEEVEQTVQAAMETGIRLAKSTWVQRLVTKALTSLNVDDDTKGPDAVNAIASAAGLLLSTTATGYGLKPATTNNGNKEVSDYISYTQPLEDKYIALEKEDAKQNPLDSDNKYSLVGSLVRSLTPENFDVANKDLFGLISTIPGLYSTSLQKLTGVQTADALYNQPSTLGDKATQGVRLSHCDDSQLQSIKASGDTFCSIVAVSTTGELGKAAGQAYDPNDRSINKLIDYMTTDQPKKDDGISTYCEINEAVDDVNTSSCGDKSAGRSIDDNGKPIEGTQYDLYLKNCTDQRKAYWGGQYQSESDGSERDQGWFSGKQCTVDNTMMENFRMWTNYCLQSGTSDGTSNCYTNDATKSDTSNSTCASNGDTKAIYTCALQYDNYGYKWGGGHGDVPNATKWIADFKTGKIPEWTPILDCSGLVRMAFVEAMGIEDQAYTAPDGYNSSKYWQKIPLEQAQQGDIVTSSGHVAIVESNDVAAKKFKIFDAETERGAKENNIRHSAQSYAGGGIGNGTSSGTIAAYRAKKG